MTWILVGATFAVLTVLGVSCRRARLDLEEQLCECLQAPVAAAVGFGADANAVAAPTVLTRIEGGGEPGCAPRHRGERHRVERHRAERHLRVVRTR